MKARKPTSRPMNLSPMAIGDEGDYQAKSDARTLMDAAEIKQDKARHKNAKVHVKKKAKAAQAALSDGKRSRYDRNAVVSRPDYE